MLSKIKSLAESVYPYVVDCFHHLHAHPELSFQEFETARFIQNELKAMNIPFRANIGGNGILGRIEGTKAPGKTIALRADMDALPIQEEVQIPWISQNQHVMHACGHDAHVACLLGAAKILNEMKSELNGTVLLVFQPGEEQSPGGASLMLQDGLFDEYKPDMIIGQHVSEDYPTGSLAFRNGSVMASADEIHLVVRGKGGHGAKPQHFNDTVLAAAQTLVSLQQVSSRLCPPFTPMVLSFGKFKADGAVNVIPDSVELSGTLRTFDEDWRIKAKEYIRRIATETCSAYGCSVEINMPQGYPCVVNDEQLTNQVRKFAQEYLGDENVLEYDQRLTSEDFGFYSQLYPSCFFRLGTRGKTNQNSGFSHSSTFCIDEEALLTGTGGLAWIAFQLLNNGV